MVEISVGRGGQLQSSETDVVKGFVVNYHALISILNQLMDRKSSVVGLNNSVGDLGRGNDRKSLHDSVWIFFSDFRNEEGTHS
jgi:hypothetical protein